MKKIPISAAKEIANKFDQDPVILVTFSKKTGLTHVVTYGKTKEECIQAAQGGNIIKRDVLKWPAEECVAAPARSKWKWKPTKEELTLEEAKEICKKKIPVWVDWHDEDRAPEDFIKPGFAILVPTNDNDGYYLNSPSKTCPAIFEGANGTDWYGNSEWVTVYKCSINNKDPLDLDPVEYSKMCEKFGLERVDF